MVCFVKKVAQVVSGCENFKKVAKISAKVYGWALDFVSSAGRLAGLV